MITYLDSFFAFYLGFCLYHAFLFFIIIITISHFLFGIKCASFSSTSYLWKLYFYLHNSGYHYISTYQLKHFFLIASWSFSIHLWGNLFTLFTWFVSPLLSVICHPRPSSQFESLYSISRMFLTFLILVTILDRSLFWRNGWGVASFVHLKTIFYPTTSLILFIF